MRRRLSVRRRLEQAPVAASLADAVILLGQCAAHTLQDPGWPQSTDVPRRSAAAYAEVSGRRNSVAAEDADVEKLGLDHKKDFKPIAF